MKEPHLSRRRFLQASPLGLAALAGCVAGCHPRCHARASFRLARFAADVTPPIGHALMGGGIEPAKEIVDPLASRGCVLLGAGKPMVLCVVEWCEIRNDAYDQWREALAEAAGTTRERVLVTCTHVHDAPISDLTAQKWLESSHAQGSICDLHFHEQAVRRVAQAAHDSLRTARTVTHVGTGQAKVDRVASNRRFLRPDGTVTYERMSSMRDPAAKTAPEGTIDPFLKILSFWNESEPLLALNVYATHPMSYYGKGGVSDDFVGLARRLRQADAPGIFQLYGSACSGNVVAGKYNDGSPENRTVLARRIYDAMTAAWRNTQRHHLTEIGFRRVPLSLPPRDGPGFTLTDLQQRLASDPKPFGQCLAALGLSWRKRCDAGQPVDLPALDFGAARLLVLPGETYVEYQLLAQQLRPDGFVVTLGYGESGPGYIPIERAVREDDQNLRDWSWVAPGCEPIMRAALQEALA
jgi:hypothetical protein